MKGAGLSIIQLIEQQAERTTANANLSILRFLPFCKTSCFAFKNQSVHSVIILVTLPVVFTFFFNFIAPNTLIYFKRFSQYVIINRL